jgi:hypothetical protein
MAGVQALADFVCSVQPGAADDVAFDGGDRVTERAASWQASGLVEGEELEGVGMRAVRPGRQGAGPAALAHRALPVPDSRDGAGVGEGVLGDAAERGVDAQRERVPGTGADSWRKFHLISCQVALFDRLAASDWFCSGGFRL